MNLSNGLAASGVERPEAYVEVVGLVGAWGSGKDTVASLLCDVAPYEHVSLSDVLRQELTVRLGHPPDRVDLTRVGDVLREERGDAWLVDEALRRRRGPVVLSGVYVVAEANRIHESGGVLVEVVAPDSVRRRRVMQRGRPGDPLDLVSALEAEAVERRANGRTGLGDVVDLVLPNAGDLEVLRNEVLLLAGHLRGSDVTRGSDQ